MNVKDVIAVVNEMEANGVIERYAIGGAVGAAFYLEPVTTLDVDVFVVFRSDPGSLLISLQPIFTYLNARGYRMEGEYIVVAGWPVQFLPVSGPLVDEALNNAAEVDVEGVRARVFTAEYLAAIALQVGRPNDSVRLLQFVGSGALDMEQFQEVVTRHALTAAWRKFERNFLGDQA